MKIGTRSFVEGYNLSKIVTDFESRITQHYTGPLILVVYDAEDELVLSKLITLRKESSFTGTVLSVYNQPTPKRYMLSVPRITHVVSNKVQDVTGIASLPQPEVIYAQSQLIDLFVLSLTTKEDITSIFIAAAL